MLQVNNLYKSYGKVEVLKGISFTIDKPGIYMLVGPNGSGKTTLIKSILGMVIPQAGEIIFDNENIKGQYKYREKISYLSQHINFPENLTGKDVINLVKNIRSGKTNEEELIETFQLESHMNKQIKNLSGGTKQKLNLVITFMYDVPFYILDEPTAGLDPLSLFKLKSIIKNLKNKYVFICTHIIDFVKELSDELIFLLDGKIYYIGPTEELVNQEHTRDLETAISKIIERQL